MRPRSRLAATLAAVVALSTLGAAPALAAPVSARSAAHFTPKPIRFHACTDAALKAADAQCGFLIVPLDWRRPHGSTIKVAVSRVRHTVRAAKYQGIMLVNPGGPGGSGLGLATLGADVPKHAGDAYDWIGFDPRGVGASVPSISCIPTYAKGPRPLYEPATATVEHAWLVRTKAYANACRKNGPTLKHMTTADVARDMDALRAALHRRQINYYGFSYGTYLGQVYSTLFPTRVRRMVLDSTVDPRGVWYRDNLDQDVAFEKTENAWFGWVAKYDAVYHLGKTRSAVRRLWFAEKASLLAHPAAGVVGPDEWTDIFLNAGYYQSTWTDLGSLFAAWVHHHDVAKLKAAYVDAVGPTDDNEFAVYNAVQCTEGSWPKSYTTYKRDNVRVARSAPFETWDNAWFNAPCLYWPAAEQRPVRIDGRRTASVLMIDETLDAATPYEGSLYVRGLYPHARLIAEPGGTTHAGTLYGNTCVDGKIAAYLATGKLPARRAGTRPDATCAPLPQPVPARASGSSASLVPQATRSTAPTTARPLPAVPRGA